MMIRIVAQLILALSVVEFVPTDISNIQMAALPEAAIGRPIIKEVSRLVSSLPIDMAMRAPEKTDVASLGIVTSAASAIVVDADSQTILYEKNIDEIRSIGSLTKLMAANVFLQTDPDLDSLAAIEEGDLRRGGRDHLYLSDFVTVRNLLEASLVGSDNPATIALMRLSGLSQEEFVARMNALADEYGMTRSQFVEPTGLNSKNMSTARDIVLMLENVLKNETLQKITQKSVTEFSAASGRTYQVPTTNALLSTYLNAPPFSVLGGKTGFLPQAGYCLGVLVKNEMGHRLYTVVLGSNTQSSRFQEVKGLTEWAYDAFTWPDELANR